jgi:galactokinase
MPPNRDALCDSAVDALRLRFGPAAHFIGIAPGRVELLGNHTDHNRGLVLAAAIDRFTCVAAAPNGLSRVRVRSETLGERDEFDFSSVLPLPRGSWSNYVRGAVAALRDAGISVRGFDAVITSNVPLGGGLSSSASLECAVAMAALGIFAPDHSLMSDRIRLAERLRDSEHRIAGVQCGILDQFSSLFGRQGHVLLLDCDTLGHDVVPLGSNPPAIVVCDSHAPRELAKGKYNERRAECEAALASLRKVLPRIIVGDGRSLRSLPLNSFRMVQAGMEPVLARRVRHVLTENERVKSGFDLLRSSGGIRGFGQIMLESHQSSRDDFDNSSAQLDLLIEIASGLPGFLGGKLSGAGWGGCTVNLVEPPAAESFCRRLVEAYASRTGLAASAMVCRAADGAHFVRC